MSSASADSDRCAAAERSAIETVDGATIFDGPAFRTRLAFDAALSNLGVHQVPLQVRLGEREPISDTAAILNGAVDAVAIRTSDHSAVTELAQHSEIPVINAMTDAGHPDGWPRSTRQPGPDRDAFMTIQIHQTTLDRAGPQRY